MAAETSSESIFNKIDTLPQFGWTPFLTHVRGGDVSTVQKLIAEGHTTNERNSYGLSALTVSVVSNNECMVELILNAPDFDYSPSASELIDPVSLASLLGFENILLILLDKLPHLVNNVTPFSGYTPIFFAAINRHRKIVKLLVERGADLRVKTAAQQTLMDVATMMSDAELVSFLMAKSGNSDIGKPRCHPRLFTPPRCLRVTGVSPVSPAVVSHGGKTPRSLIFKAHQSPMSTPKMPRPSCPINNNFLPDLKFELSDDFQNSSQLNMSSETYSYSLTSETFTPLAQSSLAFTRSTPAKNYCSNADNSGCFTPKLLSYTQLSVSPCSNRLSYSPTPDTFTPSRTYYHYSSPAPQCLPLTPLATPKFLEIPKTFQPNNGFRQYPVLKPKFLTPQNVKSRHSISSKSFLDSFITPLKMKAKKNFRTKLLEKLHKSDKSKENWENPRPGQQENVNVLESVLEYMGLQKYYTFFEINEVEPEMLSTLTDSDLRSMGIEDKKVRHSILKKIQKNLCVV